MSQPDAMHSWPGDGGDARANPIHREPPWNQLRGDRHRRGRIAWLGGTAPAADALDDQAKPERQAEKRHQTTDNRQMRDQVEQDQTDRQGS